jgi:predicted regulator of Ras-like GTPase activity (Roadblock/LC7/MglB family)
MTGMAYVLEDLKSLLARIAGEPGVALAALVDHDGFLIQSAGDMVLEAEAAGALAACLATASRCVVRDLEQGRMSGLSVECDAGLILVNAVGASALLVTVVSDPAVHSKARYSVKRALPDLEAAL